MSHYPLLHPEQRRKLAFTGFDGQELWPVCKGSAAHCQPSALCTQRILLGAAEQAFEEEGGFLMGCSSLPRLSSPPMRRDTY